MDKKEAYELGLDRGKAFADIDAIQFHTDDYLDRMFKAELREIRMILLSVMIELAHEIESTDRQFSPFEHTAYAINYADDPNCNDSHNSYCDNCEWYSDELWQAFDNGINDGIESALRERLGLEEEIE